MPAPKAPTKTQASPKRRPNLDAQAAEARAIALELLPQEALDVLEQLKKERTRPVPRPPKVKIVYHHQLPDANS